MQSLRVEVTVNNYAETRILTGTILSKPGGTVNLHIIDFLNC